MPDSLVELEDVDYNLAKTKDFMEQLKGYAPSKEGKAEGLKKLGRRTVHIAEHLVPVDTGALRKSIRMDDKYAEEGAVFVLAGDYEHTNRWGQPSHDYAAAQEFGHPLGKHGAQPYLRPAVQAIGRTDLKSAFNIRQLLRW